MKFLYNSNLIQDNIQEIWGMTNLDTYREGLGWYPAAHNYAQELAAKYDTSPMITAGIISALSPKKEWHLNRRMADDFFKKGWNKTGHWYQQMGKAKRISALRKLTTITIQDVETVLNGRKTVNFFNCIYNPDTKDHVCIDSHGMNIAMGWSKSHITEKQYDFLKEEYIKFANSVTLRPIEVQSILWLTYKKVKKI